MIFQLEQSLRRGAEMQFRRHSSPAGVHSAQAADYRAAYCSSAALSVGVLGERDGVSAGGKNPTEYPTSLSARLGFAGQSEVLSIPPRGPRSMSHAIDADPVGGELRVERTGRGSVAR
jgi:hypothetical protein